MLKSVVARRASLCTAAMLAAACTRDLDGPTAHTAPRAASRRIAAVVELTFRNIGSPNMSTSAIVGSSVAEVEAIRAALDLVFGTAAAGTTNTLGVRLNDGSGKSPALITATLTTTVTQLITADFSGDGRLDVAVGNRPFPVFLGRP